MTIAATSNTATVGTSEYSAVSNTTVSVPVAQSTLVWMMATVDCSAMAAGDQFQFTVYDKANAGTIAPVWQSVLTGAQSQLVAFPLRLTSAGWDVTAKKLAGTDRSLKFSVVTDDGAASVAGTVSANVVQWNSVAVPAPSVSGVPLVDLKYALGTVLATPTVAGIPKTEASGGSVASVSGSVGSVTGNVGGSVASVTGAVGSVTGNVGGNVVGSVASVAGNVGGSVASVTGNVGGNVVGSVGSVTGAVGSVTGNVGGSIGSVASNGIGSGSISAAELTAIAASIWGATAEGANTYANIMRLFAGVLAGTVADFTGSSLVFKSLDGSKTRLTVTVGSTGRTAITLGDLS